MCSALRTHLKSVHTERMTSKKYAVAVLFVLLIAAGGIVIASESGVENAPRCIQDHLQCVEDTPDNRIAAAREYFAEGQLCYSEFARCEKQHSGECGWTPISAELDECLANKTP